MTTTTHETKEPHEFTRHEWVSGACIDHYVRAQMKHNSPCPGGSCGNRYYRWFAFSDGTRQRITKGIFETVNNERFRKLIADGHESCVKLALKNGKTVPPEVLADYPDLQKPPQNTERTLEFDMMQAGLFHMPMNEAEAFANDPERRRRRELAEYALRTRGEPVPGTGGTDEQ